MTLPLKAVRMHNDTAFESCTLRNILPSKALAAFAALALQGVGTAQDIDNGMKLGTNQPMGPLQLADFIGTHLVMLLLCCALLVGQSTAYACTEALRTASSREALSLSNAPDICLIASYTFHDFGC